MRLPELRKLISVVERNPCFSIRYLNGLAMVTYLYHSEEVFTRELIAKELRGAVWDLETQEPISRPFHKFYNLGERLAASLPGTLGSDRVLVGRKVDGYMVQSFMRGGEVLNASRRSLSMGKIGRALQAVWEEKHESLVKEVNRKIGPATVLWELTDPENPVLEKPDRLELHLLAVRRIEDGVYFLPTEEDVPEAWRPFRLQEALEREVEEVILVRWERGPKALGLPEDTSWEEVAERIRNLEGKEGFVAATLLEGEPPRQDFVKLKSRWAFRATQIMRSFGKEVVRATATSKEDDLLSALSLGNPKAYRLARWASEEIKSIFSFAVALGEKVRTHKNRASAWQAVSEAVDERWKQDPNPGWGLAKRVAMAVYGGKRREEAWKEFSETLLKGGPGVIQLEKYLDEVFQKEGVSKTDLG